jgi:DNA-binding transcriptional regulator YiaG
MPKNLEIASLRRLLGAPGPPISQSELARRLGGVHQACVSRWEAGLVRPPKTALLLMEMLEKQAMDRLRADRAQRRAKRRARHLSEGVGA